MTTDSRQPAPADALGATILFSLILHGLVIFGVTFAIARPKPSLPTLDVTLVNTANRQRPHKADFLAQASNRGGGDRTRAQRPSQPFSGPLPAPRAGSAPRPVPATAAHPQPSTGPRLVTTRGASDFSVFSQPQQRAHPELDLPQADTDRRRQQMARLAAEIDAEEHAYAKRPRKKFISADTRQYAYASYMRAWTRRVERVGTLNFPDAARTGRLSGDLILTVGLNRDGSIRSINVIQSSGRKVLDDAAERIVRMAAPFPPIPRTGEHVDQLYITRTYRFLRGGRLEAK